MVCVSLDPNIAFAQAEWASLSNEERAARIHAAMMAAGVTSQADLARRIGLSNNAVNKWLNAATEADWSRWMSITLALGLPQTWRPERK